MKEKIGDRVFVKKETREKLDMPKNAICYIEDIISSDLHYPIAIKSHEFDERWREFVNISEIIKIPD